jgi:hypothetical protein
LDEVEGSFAAEHARKSRLAREQFAETLNQGLRRLRAATTPEQAAQLAVDISAPYSRNCAVFFFSDGVARAHHGRGLGAEPVEFSPNAAAAFQSAIETRDPVVAMGTPSEISAQLAARLDSENPPRVYLFPLLVRGEVKAVLFAAGVTETEGASAATLELISGITAVQMEILTVPAPSPRADLLSIGGAQPSAKPPRQSWADLSPDLQALHLRAQRLARLRVAEIRLEHGDAVRRGVQSRDLYGELREPIDRAREEFRRDFVEKSTTMVDYLYLDLVRGLAQDDDHLLGAGFPGPLI